MNDSNWQTATPLVAGGPTWLTLSFVLIGIGVVIALLIILWGARLAARRQRARAELEDRGQVAGVEAAAPVTHTPPVASPPPPIADAPLPASPAELPASAPELETNEPAPFADEPIAAAAPLDSAPATLAASDPSPAPVAGDDLTRMKGVGPRMAERLNAAGITRFSELAALTPVELGELDDQLGSFSGRLVRDRVGEQARYLARNDVAGFEAVFGKL